MTWNCGNGNVEMVVDITVTAWFSIKEILLQIVKTLTIKLIF